MSYGRDRDAHTRGVGAIAAADFRNPKRKAARVRAGRILRARDNALSRITFGTIANVDPNTVWPTDTVRTPVLSPTGNPPLTTYPKSGYKPPSFVTSSVIAPTTYPKSTAPTTTTGPIITPTRLPTTPVTSSGGSWSGGGGSAGTTTGGGGGTSVIYPDVPEPTELVTATDPAASSTKKKIVIGVAILGAAYLLFRKGK